MEYILKECPKCNRELPVPADIKECICMYCGEHFNMEQPFTKEVAEEEVQEREVFYKKALEQVASLVDGYESLLQQFTKEGYETSFQEYAKHGESLLAPVNRYAVMSEEIRGKVLCEVSDRLLNIIERNIDTEKGLILKKSKAILIDQYRYFMAVYLIPMLVYLKLEVADSLADRILEDWRQRYPKSEFKKATYEELASGFMRKGLCFITSAVCEILNKPDDCYELESFREFRDQYLMNQDTGRRLVEEYYLTAPRIVAYINIQPDSRERYQRIWNTFLRPCLTDIEQGRMKQCRNRYIRMVRKLSSQLPI